MSIPFLYVYVWQLSILLRKKENFIIFAADTICSCTEAVDELFQRTLGCEWIDHYDNTISICVCMSIAYSTLKKTDFHYFSFRYHLQLHWSCCRAVPVHLGLWTNRSWCQYYFSMCMYVYRLFYFEINTFSLLLLQIPSAAALKLLTSCSSTSCVVDACNMVCSLKVLMI